MHTKIFYSILGYLLLAPCTASCQNIQVLFSPGDQPTKKLISILNDTQTKIWAAVYMITDKKIAEALINAKKRGIDVQIITDEITQISSFGKAHMLGDAGVNTRVFCVPATYNSHKKQVFFRHAPAIMHNKFAIIDNILWTGSFNWTVSANRKNKENVIITDNKIALMKFSREFGILKHLSIPQQDWTKIRGLRKLLNIANALFARQKLKSLAQTSQ